MITKLASVNNLTGLLVLVEMVTLYCLENVRLLERVTLHWLENVTRVTVYS